MPQNRIIYACQAVAIAKTGHSNADTPQFEVMKGVQSVGINTTFSLEQVFEFGQADLYSNVEDIADVEVTIEKVIDGEKLLYLQAVGEIGKTNVIAASNSVCDVYLAIYASKTSTHQTPRRARPAQRHGPAPAAGVQGRGGVRRHVGRRAGAEDECAGFCGVQAAHRRGEGEGEGHSSGPRPDQAANPRHPPRAQQLQNQSQ